MFDSFLQKFKQKGREEQCEPEDKDKERAEIVGELLGVDPEAMMKAYCKVRLSFVVQIDIVLQSKVYQCGQIGRYFNILGDKISFKVGRLISDFWGFFEKQHYESKLLWLLLVKIWATFYFDFWLHCLLPMSTTQGGYSQQF